MEKKKKIILITVFIFSISLMIGLYFYFNRGPSTTPTGDNSSLIQKFNPFGQSPEITPNTPTGDGVEGQEETAGSLFKTKSRFHQITEFAVSGATYFEDIRPIPTEKITETETKITPSFEIIPSIRYVERSNGHIYQMSLNDGVINKISNTTVLSIYEAIFDLKASSVIYRYVSSDNKSITSFLANMGNSNSNFLNSDILNISLSPDKTKFFSIIKSANGVVGVIKSFEESKTSQVFVSPFSEWLSQWVGNTTIFLTTKPSYLIGGSVFSLNTTNGTLSKIFGGVLGLTTLANKSASDILYSESLNTGPTLNVFNIKNHSFVGLGKYGLPEKCVWSSDNINIYCGIPNTIVGGSYPDNWYKGINTFEDSILKINTLTKENTTFANSEDETPVDATMLFLNDKEDTLFFINKKDYTLWSFDL